MDSERFDGLVRSFGQARSRRQTLRALAGSGALLVLLEAKTAGAGKPGKHNSPRRARKKPGNSQPSNGQLGYGQNGSSGPSPDCANCHEVLVNCLHDCTATNGCVDICEGQAHACEACPTL